MSCEKSFSVTIYLICFQSKTQKNQVPRLIIVFQQKILDVKRSIHYNQTSLKAIISAAMTWMSSES